MRLHSRIFYTSKSDDTKQLLDRYLKLEKAFEKSCTAWCKDVIIKTITKTFKCEVIHQLLEYKYLFLTAYCVPKTGIPVKYISILLKL